MSYPQAIKYLESLINYEKYSHYPYKKSLKLERINSFLGLINNPHNSLNFIHVAGSKGKGSTCLFIASILREAGFKTGLYTSPHLHDFRERIRILDPKIKGESRRKDFEGLIPKNTLSGLVKKLKPKIEKFNRFSSYGALTFFEAYTALALTYFKNEKTDFVVLETGLGGRLDATNVVKAFVSVITPLSYEHTDKLGNTLTSIAREKAGIIKEGSIVVTSAQPKEAERVIKKKCRDTGSRLYILGNDILIKDRKKSFDITAFGKKYSNLKIRLKGRHQLVNAALAVSAVNSLERFGIKTGVDCIRKALYNALWPGRCEVVGVRPYVVLDGAQNASSASVLRSAIKDEFKYRRLVLVFGVSNDKDIQGIAKQLEGLADIVILTRSLNPRASDPRILSKYFINKQSFVTRNVREARRLARKIADTNDLILVTGSLFVVGEYRDDKKRFH